MKVIFESGTGNSAVGGHYPFWLPFAAVCRIDVPSRDLNRRFSDIVIDRSLTNSRFPLGISTMTTDNEQCPLLVAGFAAAAQLSLASRCQATAAHHAFLILGRACYQLAAVNAQISPRQPSTQTRVLLHLYL